MVKQVSRSPGLAAETPRIDPPSRTSASSAPYVSTLAANESRSWGQCIYDWTLGPIVKFFSWIFSCFYRSSPSPVNQPPKELSDSLLQQGAAERLNFSLLLGEGCLCRRLQLLVLVLFCSRGGGYLHPHVLLRRISV